MVGNRTMNIINWLIDWLIDCLTDWLIDQGEDGDLDVCPRCTGKVFEAEKQIAKPGSYHRYIQSDGNSLGGDVVLDSFNSDKTALGIFSDLYFEDFFRVIEEMHI